MGPSAWDPELDGIGRLRRAPRRLDRTRRLTVPSRETTGLGHAPTLEDLTRALNALASHYARFGAAGRLLLTGHSHQAWPDVAFAGQVEAWEDAAELVDEKWSRALAKAERVRRGFARLMGDGDGVFALGQNTHELVMRFLSALPLAARPRLVTTDAE